MFPLLLLAALSARAEDDPSALVEAALAAHPSLEARRARVTEMAEMADVARAWPDPMLDVMVGEVPVDSWRFSREPMAGVQVRLSQTLPEPGSKRRAAEVALADEAMAEAEVEVVAQDLALAVEAAYWRLALVRQQQALYERHLAATAELVETVRKRYEVGSTGQSSLVRLELLQGRLEQEIGDLGRMEAELQAELTEAIAEPGRAIETPAEFPALAPDGDVATWLAAARDAQPMLRALDAEVVREEARAALAQAMAAPEVTLYAAYRVRFPQDETDMGGSDLFSAGVMLPLPFASAHVASGERDAALAAAQGARARRDAALLGLERDLEVVHAGWTRASDQSTAYAEKLLPAARKARDVTFADYRVGKVEFEALYMAEVELLELEREARAAVVETRIKAAEATAVIGRWGGAR